METKTNTKTIKAGQLKAGDTFAFLSGEVFTVRGVHHFVPRPHEMGYSQKVNVTITTTHMGHTYTVDALTMVEKLGPDTDLVL